ncbi:MAG: hypothetical protein OIN66_13090 [Candidatus Methanoperedens sp.]|nr:hypothetical protein [Candidatus Methanoperedens sp.]
MSKELTVTLSDIEYEILKKMRVVEGENGEKLRNLLRLYISTIPELKSSEYALKRVENKEEIDEILREVWGAYELTDNPTEAWGDDKIDKLINALIEINVLIRTGDRQFIPTNKFRSLFKMLLHDIATENKDMDEYSAACVATIQLLIEFGGGALDRETIRDGTILINEGWMFAYATAMKKAREFMKTKRLFPEAEVIEPIPQQS